MCGSNAFSSAILGVCLFYVLVVILFFWIDVKYMVSIRNCERKLVCIRMDWEVIVIVYENDIWEVILE